MQLAAPRLNIQKTHTSFFPKVFPLERHETEKYPDLSDLQAIYHTCPSFVWNIWFSYNFRKNFLTKYSDHYVWSGPPKNHEVENWMNAYSDYTVQINNGNICGTATCLKNNDIKKLYKWIIFHKNFIFSKTSYSI